MDNEEGRVLVGEACEDRASGSRNGEEKRAQEV